MTTRTAMILCNDLVKCMPKYACFNKAYAAVSMFLFELYEFKMLFIS